MYVLQYTYFLVYLNCISSAAISPWLQNHRVDYRCLEHCLCAVPVIALTSAGIQQELEGSKLDAGQQSSNDYLPCV